MIGLGTEVKCETGKRRLLAARAIMVRATKLVAIGHGALLGDGTISGMRSGQAATRSPKTPNRQKLIKNLYKGSGYVESVSESSKGMRANNCLVPLMTD